MCLHKAVLVDIKLLYILLLRFTHPGTYNCTCIVIDLSVVAPAEYNVTLGKNVSFGCNEFGSPPFTYRWYKRSVMGDDTLLVGETNKYYMVPSTMYNDTGAYFCEVNNSLGIYSNSTPANLLGKNV